MSLSAPFSGAVVQLWPLLSLVGIIVGLTLAFGPSLGPRGARVSARGGGDRAGSDPAAGGGLLAPLNATELSVEAEVRHVLRELAPFAAERLARLELAVQAGLRVRADARVFRDVMTALVTHSIAQAPSGRVLVAGSLHGGRVQLAVLNDGVGEEAQRQASELRGSERLIALQGGTLEITSHAGEGSTILARWPDAGGERKPRRAEAAGFGEREATRMEATERAPAREEAIPH